MLRSQQYRNGISKKPFSLTLACRYLNPRRTHFSAITVISLLGVAVGVLVLMVVLGVMGGFEREIKTRILGFTPHIVLQYAPQGVLQPAVGWEAMAEQIGKQPKVEEAYAFAEDNVILDFKGLQGNIAFRAIDTGNEKQMGALRDLLEESYGGSADMGLDEKAVVSETVAKEYGLRVGDMVQLYSTRNFDEVLQAYKVTEKDPIMVEYADLLAETRSRLKEHMVVGAEGEVVAVDLLRELDGRMIDLYGTEGREMRPGEAEIILEVIMALESGQEIGDETKRGLPLGTVAGIEASLDRLPELDMEREDARVLKSIRQIVLPKDVEIIGVYKASRHVLHPGIFVPLPTGQELKGLDEGVDGVALRIEDPYHARQVELDLRESLSADWQMTSWMDQYEDWFDLIKREKLMMYFALSFIIIVSAFCIGAVMFTVTVQKKQEIGVMKALGAMPSQVVRVFLYQGMVIGVLGSVVGVLLGLVVIRFRVLIQHGLAKLGMDPFPASFHDINEIPAHVNPLEVFFICLGAFLMCSLAGLVPALFAARHDAARSLRNL